MHPYNDARVILGQASMAIEIERQMQQVRVCVCACVRVCVCVLLYIIQTNPIPSSPGRLVEVAVQTS